MSVVGAPRSQGLIARVTNILVRPRVEWDVIAGEPATVQGLFLGYAAILAAIPAAAQLVHGLTPHCSFFVLCSTPNPAWAVVSAVLDYVVWLALVLLTGIVIDALAQSFGGERSRIQAMKVAVYSCTAAWLAGALIVVPILGPLLALAGLYSLYLLYAGLGPLMKVPPDKTPIYAIVVVVVAIVIYAVASAITAQVAMMSALAGGGVTAAPGQLSGTVRLGDGA
ncbi:MAG TPA: Yip1 family protein, partial [Caulobacteraceae bacterium]|nr:Yip1 family protein [Caulobacteraceae bacterium]